MTHRMEGFQKPTNPAQYKKVKVAVIHYEGEVVSCNCGWTRVHSRKQVRESAVDRHLDKKHGGAGLHM